MNCLALDARCPRVDPVWLRRRVRSHDAWLDHRRAEGDRDAGRGDGAGANQAGAGRSRSPRSSTWRCTTPARLLCDWRSGRSPRRLHHQSRGRPALRRRRRPCARLMVDPEGEPDVFTVVEAGAGPGTLARSVLAASPRALVRFATCWWSIGRPAEHARGSDSPWTPRPRLRACPDPDDEDDAAVAAAGPIVVSLSDLPRVPGPCVVVANELLDNLPFGLLERTEDGWADVCVGAQGDRSSRCWCLRRTSEDPARRSVPVSPIKPGRWAG